MTTVLVTGGTGTLGRLVVAELRRRGAIVRVLSRRKVPGHLVGDLASGDRLDGIVDGVDSIVHCASDPRTKGAEVRLMMNLVAAAHGRDPVPMLVYVSIVGVDRVPLGYYKEKLAAERVLELSTVPWTIQRATQFHDLILTVVTSASRSPVTPVLASTSFQPIDAGEVAQRLADLAEGPSRGRVDDMGGPQVRTSADLVRTYLRATGRHRVLLPVWLPGAVGRGYRSGGHCTPQHAVGKITFEEFLNRRGIAERPRA